MAHRPIALPVEFLLCNCKEPRQALTDNREGQLPKTRSKTIVKHILVRHGNDMGLLDRVHRTQAAHRLTGKDGQRARIACAVRQRPEHKPPLAPGAITLSRSATCSTRPSPSLNRLSRTDGIWYTVELRPADSYPRIRVTLHQYGSDFRTRAPESHSQEQDDASRQRTVWASRHGRVTPLSKTTGPRKPLPMIS